MRNNNIVICDGKLQYSNLKAKVVVKVQAVPYSPVLTESTLN